MNTPKFKEDDSQELKKGEGPSKLSKITVSKNKSKIDISMDSLEKFLEDCENRKSGVVKKTAAEPDLDDNQRILKYGIDNEGAKFFK